jgi:hypothetical protein
MTRNTLTGAFLAIALGTSAMAQTVVTGGNKAPADNVSVSASSAGGTAQSATAAPAANEKKICKKLPATGTRLLKRACLTKEQWTEVDRNAADF